MKNPFEIEAREATVEGRKALVAEIPGTRWGMIWFGGPYIDEIHRPYLSSDGTFQIDGEWWRFDVSNINVWDYVSDTTLIPFTEVAMIEEITEWMSE